MTAAGRARKRASAFGLPAVACEHFALAGQPGGQSVRVGDANAGRKPTTFLRLESGSPPSEVTEARLSDKGYRQPETNSLHKTDYAKLSG